MALCLKFKWTYQEYLMQPRWFIELAHAMLDINAQKESRASKKHHG